ncbi:MAG: DNA-formamidopyrimidine glycosylase [Chloroflexota bacterium]
MPELPEVETTVRALREPVVGRTIIDVWNDWPRLIVTHDLDELKYQIHNQTVQAISRRAKYLVFHLTNGEHLIIHLKMSGHLSVVAPEIPRHKHVHTIFHLDNGKELRFKDMRKFGRVYLVKNTDEFFQKLGPEPLEDSFTVDLLKERLKGRRRIMKTTLLDQHIIAGIGNIYADEALFYAGIHPERGADELTEEDFVKLHAAIKKVLNLGIAREGASIDLYAKPDGTRGEMQNAVAVFRRTGQLCRQCEQYIQRKKLNGRSTHFCPTCQR